MLRYLKGKVPFLRNQGQEEETQCLLDTQQPCVDRGYLVYWIFFLYGIAMLLPWNVFITASDYFSHRFENTLYQDTFQSYFSSYFTTTNLVCFVFLIWRQSTKAPTSDAVYPIVLNTLVFAAMTLSVMTDMQGLDYFRLVLGLLVLTGATTSVYQAAVFAEASRFPPQYIQAVMSGQGVAGVAVAVSSLVSALASTKTSPQASAMMYFVSALVITVAALVGRVIVQQQPFYQYYVGRDTKQVSSSDVTLENEDDTLSSDSASIMDTWTMIRRSKVMTLTVAYVFAITLMVFPAITSLVKSTQPPPRSRWFQDDMFVAVHFVLFNLGDWIGRFLPMWPALRVLKPKPLLLMSLARTAFLPLFVGCNVVVDHRQAELWINSDLLYFVIVLVFSISNGYVGSLAMMAAPAQPYLRHASEKARIGTLMSFALVFGLAVGGALSFTVRDLV
ncbi:hypothetical protein DM01DRAFT_1336097 [Hesseltinella vesiculosa]|uniref:Nucleoside transporter n=1 Tax=Hesseltinella vesiculosa TaxID=101127 RepID=A0A1X2GGX8_9FUNG|nr:hypothetical protein DM01DRAFT_1336097 [Hesseltinella vesiculosa]